jgi:hypothetical protein
MMANDDGFAMAGHLLISRPEQMPIENILMNLNTKAQ